MGSMKKNIKPLFFEDKPLFGLDIGRSSLRVMQVDRDHKQAKLIGYGSTSFDPSAVVEGVIEKPEIIAQAVQDLFRNNLIGDITTNRVALSLPVSRAFTRSMEVPTLSAKELAEAVQTEAEQYIPAAVDDLYLDYSQIKRSEEKTEVFVVAMPKRVVESYLVLSRMLGLEAVLFETSIGAGAQLFSRDSNSDLPTVLVDCGAESTDITVYKGGLIVSGTVASGGEKITQVIMKALDVSEREALIIKSKYGLNLSKKQAQIVTALKPTLGQLTKEIKRMIRYYEERSDASQSIAQVLTMGGSANMPGLAEYLTNELRLPVRAFDPTSHIDFGRKQPLSITERMSFVTVAGLSLTDPTEVFV